MPSMVTITPAAFSLTSIPESDVSWAIELVLVRAAHDRRLDALWLHWRQACSAAILLGISAVGSPPGSTNCLNEAFGRERPNPQSIVGTSRQFNNRNPVPLPKSIGGWFTSPFTLPAMPCILPLLLMIWMSVIALV
jgi:hypothetical protein